MNKLADEPEVYIKDRDCPDCAYSTTMHYIDPESSKIWSGPLSTWEKTVFCDSLTITDIVGWKQKAPGPPHPAIKFALDKWLPILIFIWVNVVLFLAFRWS